MRKPNYSMERKDRERAKQAKAAAKLEKRATKGGEDDAAAAGTQDDMQPRDVEGAKREG
jgi:hypothetical protein